MEDEELECDSELSKSFAEAADNPQEFDFSFTAEREANGLANFGFDPLEAAAMRLAEQQRIDQEQ